MWYSYFPTKLKIDFIDMLLDSRPSVNIFIGGLESNKYIQFSEFKALEHRLSSCGAWAQ